MKRLERLLVTRTEGKHVARVQYKLGLAYELGRGAGRDDAKASSLYEAAAKGGHVKAMFAYAISLDEGRGLTRDPTKAVEWFQHAAAKGSAKAQFSLGIRFAEGRGVSRDPGRALHWFEKVFNSGVLVAFDRHVALATTRRRVDDVSGGKSHFAAEATRPLRHRRR